MFTNCSDSGLILTSSESLKIFISYDLLSNYELNGLCLVKYGRVDPEIFTDLVVEVDRNFLSILCTNSGIICSHFKINVWAISGQYSDLKMFFLCQNDPLNMNNTVAPTTGSDYGN